jgi:hypothetical protein
MPAVLYRIVIVLAALLLAGAVRAENAVTADPGEMVPGTHGVTYLDLLRQIVPDIAAIDNGYEGHRTIELRHIGGDEMASDAPDPIDVSAISVLPVQSDGKDRLLLLVDLGYSDTSVASFSVLALLTTGDGPKLLDAADVGYDRLTGFNEPAALSLGEGKTLIITQSSHFNSNQNYEATPMILLRNDRLQLVDVVWTFDDHSCSYERHEVPHFRSGDRDARAYFDVVATVTETTTLSNEDCGDEQPPQPGTRTFTVTYRWDDAVSKFLPDSDAFDRLAKENEERF